MKLEEKQLLEVIPTSPFHFDSTFYKPGHFPSSDTKWESGKRCQTMLWYGKRLGLIYKDASRKNQPKVKVEIYSDRKLISEFLNSLRKEIIWRFNLDLDLNDFYKAIGDDPVFKPVIKRFEGLRPMSYSSLYEYLIIAIMLQNTVVRRSVSMLQSLFERYGTLLEYDGVKLWSCWEPKVMANADEQQLRTLKIGYRAKSLIKVSIPFAEEEINEFELRNKSIEEQERILDSIYGVGPQSLDYIMVDALHRFDYLQHISPWEQKILSMVVFNKELVPVEKLLKYFERWEKWKALAAHYLWEDIWWKRRNESVPWLEKLIRL